MSDVLREFLVAVGYQVDGQSERKVLDSERRVEQALVTGDKRITTAQTAGAAKRALVVSREQGIRTRGAAVLIAETRKVVGANDQRLKAEVRAAEVRENLQAGATRFAQGLTTTLQGVAAAVVGSSVALATVAISSTAFFEKMAAGLERLYYSSQRTKSSAASLQSFGYAASQMGSSVEEAIGTVETLAEKMRASPGYEAMFKGLGVNTRDAKGNLRETTDVLLDLGDAFRKMPVFQQKAYADALGIPERVLSGLVSGDFRKNIDRYQKMLGMAGLNPDEAAAKSKKFMDGWRDMSSAISIVATKVEGALIDKFGGALEKFTTWLLANSDSISNKIIAIGEVLGGWVDKLFKLFEAFQKLDPSTRDFLIKIGALAAALLLFNSGPIGALVAMTAALVAFVDADTLKKLGEMWEAFDRLAQKLTGADGLTVAFGALGAMLALKVLAPLLRILPLLTSMMGLTLPPWLLAMLGLGALAGAANANGVLAGPGDSRSTGESILRTLDPGIADRVYGQTAGGRAVDAKDDRNLWQKIAPKALGGKDAPGGSADVGSGSDYDATVDGKRYRSAYKSGGRERVQSWLSFYQRPTAEGGLGMPPDKARAMVAMTQGESGINLNPGSVGSAGEIGTAQWLGPRAQALKALAAQSGKHWTDVGVQQQHMRSEMLGAYRNVYNRVMQAPSGEAALAEGINNFERPKYPGKAYAFRLPYLHGLRRMGDTPPQAADTTKAPNAVQGAVPAAAPDTAKPLPTTAPTLTMSPEAMSRIESGLNKAGPKASAWEANPFKAAPLGGWSTSSTSTTNNITTGPVTNHVSGVGDAKKAAEVIGEKTSRVHADLLRNLKGAVA